MIEHMKWHNKDQIVLKKWAYYESSFEKAHTFLTLKNDCIMLYSKGVIVRANQPIYLYKVVHLSDFETSVFDVQLPFLVDVVEHFSNGHYLFAKQRSFYGEATSAVIVSATGEMIHKLHLGDAVQQIQIDSYDQIWVSYYTTTTYEQMGWTKETAMGNKGIVVYNSEGKVIWTAEQLSIIGCLAMNIGIDDYYFYAFNPQPYLHLFERNHYCTYECEEKNITQLMPSREQSLIVMNDKQQLKRLLRDEYTYIAGQRIELIDEAGHPITGHIVMRNDTLLCINGDTLYKYDVNESLE